jgi:hypothetical protein
MKNVGRQTCYEWQFSDALKVYIKNNLNMPGGYEMAAVVSAKEEKNDYSEAAYVDSQYEYLQKHKSEGITLEELRRRRADQR